MSDTSFVFAGQAAPALEERKDLGPGPDAAWRFWVGQLMLAYRGDEDWIKKGRKIVERYRDERDDATIGNTESKFNVLWANVEILKPVLYGRRPNPDVQRRHKDQQDPAADTGSEILQSALEWEDDIEELDDVMQQVVEDRLLPGRGVARVFYESKTVEAEGGPETEEEEEEFAEAGGGNGQDQDQNADQNSDQEGPDDSQGGPPGGPPGPGVPGPLGSPGGAGAPTGAPTLPKAAVGYEEPARGTDHCGECAHFVGPDGCELVQGSIAADGWCRRFTPGYAEPELQPSPVIRERAPIRYVFWEDYRESPARTEREIWWKAYRSFLTRDQLVERFGSKLGYDVPLDYTPSGLQLPSNKGGPLPDAFKKATIWEIWDATKQQTVWLAESYGQKLLDTLDDPLGLPGFFPSPPALRATTTNNKRTPVPDYYEYQDQALELDLISERISRLTRALKVVGVYAGSDKAVLQQVINDDSENRMIPVEDWAAFAGDKGGLPQMIQYLPVQQIADVVVRLYDARERILNIIYQTTGLADILRGETNPVETLGAQQLKSQFATRRISRAQKDVARFARDLLRLRAAVIARHFAPETLSRMTGMPQPMPPLPPAPAMLIPAPIMPPAPPQLGPPGAPPGPPGGPPMGPPGVGPGGPPGGPPVGPPGGPPMMPPGGAPMGPPVRPALPGPPPPMIGPGGPVVGGPGPVLPPRAPVAGPPGPPWRRAPDGRYYRPDPTRPGRYLMLA